MVKKTAVVIGATRNLGLYVAQRLADQDWSVVGIGRAVPMEATGIQFVPLDLTRDDSVGTLITILKDTAPDLIVSNAVTYGSYGQGVSDIRGIEEMFRVNALVPFLALSAHLETTPASAETSCVIVNSDAIFHANRRVGPYAASKAASKVLSTALADICRGKRGAVATLLLGPLADERKLQDCARVAEKNGLPVEAVVKTLLKKGNPFYLKETFLQFDECFRSIEYIQGLGAAANGMVCKLDGGASGSLY
jgi:NAD(P)-dependent dehydrogenase (short-subunit alcohol dehydrogenase family)